MPWLLPVTCRLSESSHRRKLTNMAWRKRTHCISGAAIVVLSTFGCAQGLKLHSVGSGTSPASRYVTFFLLPGSSSGSPDIDRQLNAEIESALDEKGLVKTSPEEAEAVVIVHTATPARRSRQSFYEGWGGWAWRLPDTGSPAKSEDFTVGSVVVDIFDAWTKKLVWHGSARHAVSTQSNENAHALERAVTTMFAEFPPADSDAGARTTAVGRSAVTAGNLMSIIFSPRPAFLVEIDGEPEYENVDGTPLKRVVNANAIIIRDETGMHYLRVAGRWTEAYDAIGPWAVAGTVPDGADIAISKAMHQPRSDLLGAMPGHDSMPAVFVTTRPAALIVTDGEPEYASVDGTSLLYMKNTSASVFKEPTDKELYVHLPSGWFRAWTTNGPWQPVSETDLPADLTQLRTFAARAPATGG